MVFDLRGGGDVTGSRFGFRNPTLTCGVIALGIGIAGCASSPPEQPRFQIEKPALMVSNQLQPQYPTELLASRDTGTVRIRVIVSPNGRAVMSSVEVLSTSHPAFTKAVLRVLPEYRFIPAEVGGTLGGCRATNHQSVEVCTGGRPGKRVAMPVDLAFRFELPPALEPRSPPLPPAAAFGL